MLQFGVNIFPKYILWDFAWNLTSTSLLQLHGLVLCTGRSTIVVTTYTDWATGWTIRVLGFDSRRGLGIFLFITASRTALRPTQPPIQWVPGALSLGVKWPGREADHSNVVPMSKNVWSYTSTSQYVFMAWCLVTSPLRSHWNIGPQQLYNCWGFYSG
jgi:hypothetical protein